MEQTPLPKQFITVGLLGAVAVALGALGAHALRIKMESGVIDEKALNGFDTGVRYQIYHTFAIALVLVLKHSFPGRFLNWAYHLFFWGIILFSGSLYILCTRNLWGMEGQFKFLGPITPVGGLLFVGGWLCLVLAAIKKR